MNKYLEKIASEGLVKQALNAQKAREMAKKVGVIADPDSNWKYALRNLRDGRGNPLEGQAKREAINRLAGGRDVHRELQQMSGAQRKLRDVDEMQSVRVRGQKDPLFNSPVYGAAHTRSEEYDRDVLGHLLSDSAEASASSIHPHLTLGNTKGLDVSHIHPTTNFNSATLRQDLRDHQATKSELSEYGRDPRLFEEDLSIRVGTNKRNVGAIPSGGFEQKKAFRHMGKDERRRVYTDDPDIQGMVGAGRDIDLARELQTDFRNNTILGDFTHTQRAGRMPPTQGDMGAFSSTYLGKVNPIYSPSTGVVGLHKVIGSAPGSPIASGHRSIYLDMSPRNAPAPALPYVPSERSRYNLIKNKYPVVARADRAGVQPSEAKDGLLQRVKRMVGIA